MNSNQRKDKKVSVGYWPRLCENPNPEISSGNCSLYFLALELDVGILCLDKQINSPFDECRPKNRDGQIVFTQPRPGAAIRDAEICPYPISASQTHSSHSPGVNFSDLNNGIRPGAASPF